MTIPGYIEDNLTEHLNHHGDLVIEGDIAAGVQLVVKEGSLTVEGKIGRGAQVTVLNGGLRVEGDIGAEATINQIHSHIDHGDSVVEIAGNTGASVQFSATAPVHITGNIGQENTVFGLRDVTANHVGDGTKITGSFIGIAGNTGTNVNFSSLGSIAIQGNLGAYGDLKANGSIEVTGEVGFDSTLAAGKSIICGNVSPSCKLNAAETINAGYVSRMAKLEAGGAITRKGESADPGYGFKR